MEQREEHASMFNDSKSNCHSHCIHFHGRGIGNLSLLEGPQPILEEPKAFNLNCAFTFYFKKKNFMLDVVGWFDIGIAIKTRTKTRAH